MRARQTNRPDYVGKTQYDVAMSYHDKKAQKSQIRERIARIPNICNPVLHGSQMEDVRCSVYVFHLRNAINTYQPGISSTLPVLHTYKHLREDEVDSGKKGQKENGEVRRPARDYHPSARVVEKT